jgi:hypothetical protein
METDRYGIIPARVPSAIAITLNASFQSLSPAISNSLESVVLLSFIGHPFLLSLFVEGNFYKIPGQALKETKKDTIENSSHLVYFDSQMPVLNFCPKFRLNLEILCHNDTLLRIF